MQQHRPPIENIFPSVPEDEREAAEERWCGYLDLVARVRKYVASDPERHRRFREQLTKVREDSRMQDRVDD